MTSVRLDMLARLLLAGLAAALLMLVARYSFVAYLAEVNPPLALRLDSHHPGALFRVAARIVAEIERSDRASPPDGVSAEPGPGTAPRLARFAAPPLLLGKPAEEPPPATALVAATAPATDLARHDALTTARSMIERAILAEPLDYRSLTLRARIEELLAIGAPDAGTAAARFYQLAADLSVRASEAHHWLMRHHLESGRFDRVLVHADTLLRTSHHAGPLVVPVLARLAELPAARHDLLALLSTNPPWRRYVLQTLCHHIADARTPLAMLIALQATPDPPTTADINAYLIFLMARRLPELAYYAWLQLLPAAELEKVGLLYNGGFDAKPSGAPFDWTIRAGAGVTVGVAAIPDEPRQTGLRIDFAGTRAQLDGVVQNVLLTAGSYTLGGRYRGELVGLRGMRWRVYCDGRRSGTLAETAMQLASGPAWQSFRLSFLVPPNDCASQQVVLEHDARSTSERIVRGTIWYDDLRLTRGGETTTEPR